MTGRPAVNLSSTSVHSVSSQISQLDLDSPQDDQSKHGHHDNLLSHVAQWLHEERARRKARRSGTTSTGDPGDSQELPDLRPRSDSQSSDTNLALDKLERILSSYAAAGKEGLTALGLVPHGRHMPSFRRPSISRKMKRASVASSDTEWYDGDILVPNVEAYLDNSKTLAYSGGLADNEETSNATSERKAKDKQHWDTFKKDIVRLTHTLRLKGWRRIPIENGEEIDVERLSGALTNAVYVVSPPKALQADASQADSSSTGPRRQPQKLLLRVYGPQVEHLIDRDSELAILRRLSRKRIGPRLLGTFTNGRFEEFLHARTLTPQDLRDPNTSTHIAKRMRELHEGVELLPEEREGGPFVFKNWDSWVDRCERVITWLDEQILAQDAPVSRTKPSWKSRGLVLGVEWSIFRHVVEKARKYLYDYYGGSKGVRDKLVFAHNDTQYGNLLRLTPSGTSPLLLPANSHKQLVVIDFEYASANLPAVEFANHFTEWCYNYHHGTHPHRCTTTAYPSPQEQHRFLKAYVEHRPQFNISTSTSTTTTPKLGAVASPGIGGASSISTFMLDSRAPPGGYPFPAPNYDAEEKAREEATEKEIQQLMHETRLWRMANSAQWVAWGIVQAKMPEEFEKSPASASSMNAGINEDDDDHKQGEDSHSTIAMTDPLSPEIQQLRSDARNDRPEGRRQEEEHREGEDHSITVTSMNSKDEKVDNSPQVDQHPSDPKAETLSALLRIGSREGENAQAAEAAGDPADGPSSSLRHSPPSPLVHPQEHKDSEDPANDGEEEGDGQEEFDYLAYAQDRALFFWGDVIQLGILGDEELKALEERGIGKRVKKVEY